MMFDSWFWALIVALIICAAASVFWVLDCLMGFLVDD